MRRDVFMFFALALIVRAVGAAIVPAPPHVDAAYYTMVAEELARWHGFSAPALWSFLEVGGRLPAAATLPIPSNGHWMPLPAMAAAASMLLLGPTWGGGQAAMVILSAALVPATYLAAFLLGFGRRVAVLASIIGLAGGSLLLMYPLVESFAVFGLCGAVALAASVRAVDAQRPGPWLVLAGGACGLAALTRIDGALLCIAPAAAWFLAAPASGGRLGSPARAVLWGAAAAAAFCLVVSPWLLRNLMVFGEAFPSAAGRLLWIRDYNEQFSLTVPATPDRYLAWGLPAIVLSKVGALLEVAGRTLGVLGGIFGISFVYGLWHFRRNRRFVPVIAYVVLMLVAMVLIFTEHAPKGAFVHTAPAWLPFALPISVAAIAPLAASLGRAWPFLRRPATHRFLEVTSAAGAIILSVAGAMSLWAGWMQREGRMDAAASFLADNAQRDDVALAADAPGLYLRTGLGAVGMPFDPYPVIDRVIDAYHVRWVVLVLDGDSRTDPLGLWAGRSATDAEGNPATFLSAAPAFESDGVRIFRVSD